MNSLSNNTIITNVIDHLDISGTCGYAQLNQQTHAQLKTHPELRLKTQQCYSQAFGEIESFSPEEEKYIRSLLASVEKRVDTSINHNIYRTPTAFLERWKWLAGVENSLHKKVQENYHTKIRLLERTQATSIFQLQNQLEAFWHLDRQVIHYKDFQQEQQKQLGFIGKLFCSCLQFLYAPSSLALGKTLQERSQETRAKIGDFSLQGKEYEVLATHILADERTPDLLNPSSKFYSSSSGKTYIHIVEKGQYFTQSYRSSANHRSFSVLIGRLRTDNRRIHSEYFMDTPPVSDKARYLQVFDLEYYNEGGESPTGSDRNLDQKLTQVMIELSRQNREIFQICVDSNHDDFIVLAGGGFQSTSHPYINNTIRQELTAFRSEPRNGLFPPYQDYGGLWTAFNPGRDFEEEIVSYSRGADRSWSSIIEENPILKKDSATLPEYWVKKPNIVEE